MALEDRPLEEQVALAYCAPRGIPLSTFFDRWTLNDRMAALDWLADQNGRCPGCGQKVDECMADIEVSPEYVAEAKRCHACEVRRITMEEADAGNASTLYATVRKVTT
jgi:hypothetical protein